MQSCLLLLAKKSLWTSLSSTSHQLFSGCSNKKKGKGQEDAGPIDPTMAEFFGRKPTIEEIQKLLSPAGFLSETQFKDYEGVTVTGEFEQLQPAKKEKVLEEKASINDTQQPFQKEEYLVKNLNEWGMPQEVGFKVKGPEPTRFGDWERKGRVTDF